MSDDNYLEIASHSLAMTAKSSGCLKALPVWGKIFVSEILYKLFYLIYNLIFQEGTLK
ncbi:MAG: hypothetical protein J6T41_02140 [Neisseriaceae bacterium]|nr:hypothetical protein [Neisseriaceae bacterium]